MKKRIKFILYALCINVVFLLSFCACKKHTTSNVSTILSPFSFSVLQFNIWQEGTKIQGGFDAIVTEIAMRKPDFVTLSEVRNYNSEDFMSKLVEALKQRSLIYYAQRSDDNGVLSKHPIGSYTAFDNFHKLITTINGQEIAIYSAHLDYTHYACYLPRGYDGNTFKKLAQPVTDIPTIMHQDEGSTRLQSINIFLQYAQKDIDAGRLIIMGGDFNEPSHLDWTEKTKNLFDHRGVIAPWRCSMQLLANGFKDSYRVRYPNEVDYPGFTWVAQSTWTPDADERDRIDYIYYHDNKRISVRDSYIVGPKESIVKNSLLTEISKDVFSLPTGSWPSDHKAVMTIFDVN